MSDIIELTEMKMKTVQEVGRRLDDKLTAATVEVHRNEGARGVMLGNVIPGLESVKSVWRKDLENEVITPDVAALVFKAIDQCEGCVRNLAEKAQASIISKQGEIAAYRMSVDLCEKTFALESAKVKGILTALERGDEPPEPETSAARPTLRVVGLHPGGSIAAQRRAEGEDPVQKENPLRQVDISSVKEVEESTSLLSSTGDTDSSNRKLKRRKPSNAENPR
jgi:hypothetical protein